MPGLYLGDGSFMMGACLFLFFQDSTSRDIEYTVQQIVVVVIIIFIFIFIGIVIARHNFRMESL